MKKYKSDIKNQELRRVVKRYSADRMAGVLPNMKYYTQPEFVDALEARYNISHALAEKAAWIVRSDGARDEEAIKIFGFNKRTA